MSPLVTQVGQATDLIRSPHGIAERVCKYIVMVIYNYPSEVRCIKEELQLPFRPTLYLIAQAFPVLGAERQFHASFPPIISEKSLEAFAYSAPCSLDVQLVGLSKEDISISGQLTPL